MTLIELLIWYRDLVKEKGREEASKLMHRSCDSLFWPYIEMCVDEDGQFISAKKEVIKLEKTNEKEKQEKHEDKENTEVKEAV